MANIINAITTGLGGLSTTADTSGAIQIQTNNGTAAMTIDTSQKVGIGTTSPTTKLDVVSSAINDYVRMANAGYQGYFGVENGAAGAVVYSQTTAGAAAPLVFGTGATEKLRVGTAGEIGIGGANYGTSGQVLTSGGSGAAPSWTTPSSGGMTLLGTVTATSGNSVSLGSLNLSSYKYLYVVSNGLTSNTASALCYISSTNVNTTMGVQCTFSSTVGQITYGALIWDLTTGFSEQQGYGYYATSSTYDTQRTNLTTASTTIYFRLSTTATFTGTGSFIVYGVK